MIVSENLFSGEINLGLVGTIVVGFGRVLPTLQLGFMGISYIRSSKALFQEFTELVMQMTNSISKERNVALKIKDVKFEKITINIRNHNDGEGRPHFKNLTLNINKGDKIALVGPSGSGKTSLIDLILGLNKIEDGNIVVCKNGEKYTVNDLRSYASLIPQQIFVKYGNMIENFQVYLNNKDLNLIKFKDAMIYSRLISKNTSNEEFYKLINSKNVKNLSGGEKQRFAFCRAFYQDKDFLIIDEGTSNLDVERKTEILDTVCEDKDKTIIFITHDNTIFNKFDKMYLISNGKVKLIHDK